MNNPVFLLRRQVSGKVAGTLKDAGRSGIQTSASTQLADLRDDRGGFIKTGGIMNIEPAKPRQPVVDTESLTRDYNRLMTYRKMEGAINTDLAFSNLDTILKQPRRILLEWHLKSMYHVDLSND